MDQYFENLQILPQYGPNIRRILPNQLIKRIQKSKYQGDAVYQRKQLLSLQTLMKRQLSISDNNTQFENVVSIYQIHETANSIFVVMEECDEQLYQNISKKDSQIRGNQNQIIQVAQQIIKGYNFLRTTLEGFYHGNINLNNLLIKTINGRTVVKIANFFEISKPEDIIEDSLYFSKLMYSAPELQKDSFQPTILSDIYSIGICLYLMLNGLQSQISFLDKTIKFQNQSDNKLHYLIIDMTHQDYHQRISWTDLQERVLYQHTISYSYSLNSNNDKNDFLSQALSLLNYYKTLENNQFQFNSFIRQNKLYLEYFNRIECLIEMFDQSDDLQTFYLIQLIYFISRQGLSLNLGEVQNLKYQNLELVQIKQYFISISAITLKCLCKYDQIKQLLESEQKDIRQLSILLNLQRRSKHPKYFKQYIQTLYSDYDEKNCCIVQ